MGEEMPGGLAQRPMIRRLIGAASAAAPLAALPLAANAQDFDLTGYGEARLVLPAETRSWLEGGLGKLRFGDGGSQSLTGNAAAVAEGRAQLIPQLGFFVDLRVAPDQKTALDLLQGYAKLSPVTTSAWQWTVKLGAFFPPISLENEGVGWTSPWTLTPSAINSWVGDELRTIGGESELQWRYATGALGLTAAVYGWNDPTGALLADRGWAFDDRPIGLFDNLRLPDALAQQFHAPSPLWEQPFVEIDDQPGWYLGLTWRQNDWGRVTVLRYDNRANPALARAGEFAWATDFTAAGLETYVGEVVLLAQAMSGETTIAPAPTFTSVTNFQSAYLLAGYYFGDWRVAARADVFATQEHHPGPSTNLSEHGYATTLALTWSPRPWLRVTGEVLRVVSSRVQRASVGLPVRADETQFQLATRLFF
jgi:hypothetical protein